MDINQAIVKINEQRLGRPQIVLFCLPGDLGVRNNINERITRVLAIVNKEAQKIGRIDDACLKKHKKIAKKFGLQKKYRIPTAVFLTADGGIAGEIIGFTNTPQVMELAKKAIEGKQIRTIECHD